MQNQFVLENLEFDPRDPFDLGYHIFDNLRSYLTESEFENFKYDSNKALLEAILRGEMRSKYQCIAFSELMQDQYMKDFFLKMSTEESEHGDIFTYVVNKAYGSADAFNEANKTFYEDVSNPVKINLQSTLSSIFTQEIKVVCMFSIFYADCKNEEKKKFIGKLIADEVPHTTHVGGVVRDIVSKLPSDQTLKQHFFAVVKGFKYIMLPTIKSYISEDKIVEVYETSEWHNRYLNKLHDKLFDLLQAIDPSVTMDEFIENTKY